MLSRSDKPFSEMFACNPSIHLSPTANITEYFKRLSLWPFHSVNHSQVSSPKSTFIITQASLNTCKRFFKDAISTLLLLLLSRFSQICFRLSDNLQSRLVSTCSLFWTFNCNLIYTLFPERGGPFIFCLQKCHRVDGKKERGEEQKRLLTPQQNPFLSLC